MSWGDKNKNMVKLPPLLRRRDWYNTISPYDRILLLLEQDPNSFSDIELMRMYISVSTWDVGYLCKLGFIEAMSEHYKKEKLDEKQRKDIKNSYRLTMMGLQHLSGLHVMKLTEHIKTFTKILIGIGVIQMIVMLASLIIS